MDENLTMNLPASFSTRSVWADGSPRSSWSSGTIPNGAGWRQRIVVKGGLRPRPEGWLFPTSYKYDVTQMNAINGRIYIAYRPAYGEEVVGSLQGAAITLGGPAVNLCPNGDNAKGRPWPDIDHVSQAEAKALAGLLTHGGARDGTFDVGTAWAERRETFRLLTDFAQTIARVSTDLRSGRPKRAFQNLFPHGSRKEFQSFKGTPYWKWYQQQKANGIKKLKASPAMVASGFLSLQNGWKPLLGDIHRAAEALANRNTKADWVITGKGYHELELVREDLYHQSGLRARCAYSHQWTSKRAVFVRLDATVSDQHLHLLAQLGLNNPASIAWNAARLTYLVDYVYGMGDYLESLGAPDGLSFYSGSVTRYGEYVCTLTSNEHSSRVSFSGSMRHVRWERGVYGGFPVPIPPLSLKPKPLKLSQYFNALSVFYLAVTGRRIPQARA